MTGIGGHGGMHGVKEKRPGSKAAFGAGERKPVVGVEKRHVCSGECILWKSTQETDPARPEIGQTEIRHAAAEKKCPADVTLPGRGAAGDTTRHHVVGCQ